jgi:hypothetical protein
MARNRVDTSKILKSIEQLKRTTTELETKTKGANATLSVTLSASKIDTSLLKTFIDRFPKEARRAHEFAINIVASSLLDAFDEAMNSDVWQWTGGPLRDIVDTGSLRDSGRVVVTSDTISIFYDQEYAAMIYYGGMIHPFGNESAVFYIPGRPWIEAVLLGNGPVERFNFDGVYEEAFSSQLSKLLDL